MTDRSGTPPSHLLIYEPRTEGHHTGWLRFLTEDLLSANVRLTLAVDLRPEGRARLNDRLADLMKQVTLLSPYDAEGRRRHSGETPLVTACLKESGADQVFLAAFDEMASGSWRRSAFGIGPPVTLRGRVGGIYHRPRFLDALSLWPFRALKVLGFRRWLKQGWLKQLLFVDEFLAKTLQDEFPKAPIFFLPDPCPTEAGGDLTEARRRLGVPLDRPIFLFYGTGHRRKGLHLAVQAMLGLSPENRCFLLCVGQQNPRGGTAEGLDQLVRQGRALLIDRYVSAAEEQLSFAACDTVLLPYVNHFGTSGVLSRAMAAGKMVIVSDEQLLGRLTREHGLGLLFPSGDVAQLRECLRRAAQMGEAEMKNWRAAALKYSQRYSRAAFRQAVLSSLSLAPALSSHA
jgi:glycosyltransferase involved in cell wall biosynthesis